ncbi:SagB family peptide dehydrogenase [Mesorhizobium calcicola]|uniref:SagB family peptide dehydrogenase n=1 Tax=Mesorhizobium calcicola TaxID=1300310 RepID=A0ABW4WBP3_9HYPH
MLALEWIGQQAVLAIGSTGERRPIDPVLVGLLARLGEWAAREELRQEGIDISVDSLDTLVQLGVLETSPGENRATACGWHPFDLDVLQIQSIGGVAPRTKPPPPPFRPAFEGRRIELPRGALPAMTLAEALSRRRSLRRYGARPLSLADVGVLLEHAARVVAIQTDSNLGEIVYRPYAAAGARSELELYVMANRIEHVVPGLYHYEAREHRMIHIRAHDKGGAALNAWLNDAMGQTRKGEPQLVLVIAAVLERLFWKYGRFGLTLAYQDVGCLYQTLYLLATALGLSPCAVGAGRARETAKWLGVDELTETPIGYFVVGVPEADLA